MTLTVMQIYPFERQEQLEARLGIDRPAIGEEAFICVDEPQVLVEPLKMRLKIPPNPAIGWSRLKALRGRRDLEVCGYEDAADGRVAIHDPDTGLIHTLRFGRDLDASHAALIRAAPTLPLDSIWHRGAYAVRGKALWDVHRIGTCVAWLTNIFLPVGKTSQVLRPMCDGDNAFRHISGYSRPTVPQTLLKCADLPIRSAAEAALRRLQATRPLHPSMPLDVCMIGYLGINHHSDELYAIVERINAHPCTRPDEAVR